MPQFSVIVAHVITHERVIVEAKDEQEAFAKGCAMHDEGELKVSRYSFQGDTMRLYGEQKPVAP